MRGKCETICSVLTRPQRKSIGPDINRLTRKLIMIDTLVVSANEPVRLIILFVKSVLGIILGASISYGLLLTAIDLSESLEKKKIGFITFMIILSLLIPYDIDYVSLNIT